MIVNEMFYFVVDKGWNFGTVSAILSLFQSPTPIYWGRVGPGIKPNDKTNH